MVISVSRRCDIPRFAFGWFLEKLADGFVEVKNPFNSAQLRRVSLESPALFAFWTRDPAAILEHAADLENRGYGFFVMTSLTSYPAILEPNVPSAGAVIPIMRLLAEKIGPEKVIWRYDPLFLSNFTDFDFHRRNFASLAAALNGAVKRVIISIYDEYRSAERRLAALEAAGLQRLPHYCEEPGAKLLLQPVKELLADLAGTARKEGMEIQSCAEEDLSGYGIKAGACIDGDYIARLFGEKTDLRKDPGQKRSHCLCVQSVDIGSYGPCPAGCVYCYGAR